MEVTGMPQKFMILIYIPLSIFYISSFRCISYNKTNEFQNRQVVTYEGYPHYVFYDRRGNLVGNILDSGNYGIKNACQNKLCG